MMPLRTLRAAALLLALATAGLLPTTSGAQTADLIISEYVEGSGNNKALEIFNGTEDVVNLGTYVLDRYSNGGVVPTPIALPAVDLQPGQVWLITSTLADGSLLALADQTSVELNFNGNDALVLRSTGGGVIDSFGQVGVDPGLYWSCPDGTTQNHTLRRLSSICAGDTDPYDAFDPCDGYSFLGVDTVTGLGYHIADCGAVADENTTWGGLKASYR